MAEKKKFKSNDPISCRSITAGGLTMVGKKTGIVYHWYEMGQSIDVEYQDIIAAEMASSDFIMKPYFMVEDSELIEQRPNIAKVYASFYSIKNLEEVLKMPISQMKTTIASLPNGAKESIKNIAATQIQNGKLDSVKKIKALDEIFNTQLMLLTELFGEN